MSDAQRAVLGRSVSLALACAVAFYCGGIVIGLVSAPPHTVSQALAEGVTGRVGLGVGLFVVGGPLLLSAPGIVAWFYVRAGRRFPN